MSTHDIEQGFLEDATDLTVLSHIKKEDVEAFAQRVNTLDSGILKGKSFVIALGTGGTISMREVDGTRIPDLDLNAILYHADPKLKDFFQVEGFDAFCVDSSQMDYSHVQDLAIVMCYLHKHVTHSIAGFMVLHGTDTMAYSGAALSLMTGAGLPFSVVYTGAQKPIQEILSDAPVNLRNSLFVLEALYHHNMAEVVIVMGRKAVRANGAMKVDDEGMDAFDSPMHQYITRFDRLRYPMRLSSEIIERRSVPFKPEIFRGKYSHTLTIHSALGLNPEMVRDQILSKEIHAVILYSYGASTCDEAVLEVVSKTCAEKNIPAFVVNPVNGDVNSALYPSAKKMLEQGVVPLLMSLPSALVKIEIALRKHTGDIGAIRQFMATNYVGEVPVYNPEKF